MSSEAVIHVLVVDDHDNLRRGTARLLELAGYVVTTAANGAEALVSLRDHPPHLVLLDRRLPDTDGLEICRHLKGEPATANIFVIMVSGQLVDYEAQAGGLEAGADGYIARPIENRELLARVAAFARLARINLRWEAEVARRRQLEASLEERVQLRTQDLTTANQKLEEARQAALQVMQEATRAQQQLAIVNQELRGEMAERGRVEAALRETEERFRMLASLAPVGVYLCDLMGHCTYANPRWCEMAGLSPEAALGNGWVQGLHPEDRDKILAHWAQMVASEGHWALEYRFQTPDGRVTWVHGLAAAQRDASGKVVGYVGVNTDITERKRDEDEIRRALAERDVLLKEVHHRVKNNLQVVSGLLDLQAERLLDPQVRHALKESQSRIKSIALVHEKLYQSEGLARLDFKAYAQSLVAHLFHAYLGKGEVVHLDLRMPDVTLDLTTAVPCGLLINELVTNALKHAFPRAVQLGSGRVLGGAGGPESRHEILVALEDAGQYWRMTVGDNGRGLPVGFDWVRTESLGLRLVTLLARQLKGGVRLEPGSGCRFVIEFAKP
jgi:PAS domain S-box-containing protein